MLTEPSQISKELSSALQTVTRPCLPVSQISGYSFLAALTIVV